MRSIGVFTANRSEFGVLVSILRAIDAHPQLTKVLLVAGMQLADTHGATKEEIIAEGFDVDYPLDVGLPVEREGSISTWVGSLTGICGQTLSTVRPDFLAVPGDRYELLAPVTAALLEGIPIAHISGGDLAKGAFHDDGVRHTISRLAHLHFPGTEDSGARLIGMGEEAWRVHNIGEPCIDNLFSDDYPSFVKWRNRST
ncbi:MAG: UDP-N-acetylglucosamine 2-epimerase [Phycisphaerales bacterium]|nr:MAG: UDP-N-acetylglucosamine 2-epimerase [Phycisphaerales bacterium]